MSDEGVAVSGNGEELGTVEGQPDHEQDNGRSPSVLEETVVENLEDAKEVAEKLEDAGENLDQGIQNPEAASEQGAEAEVEQKAEAENA